VHEDKGQLARIFRDLVLDIRVIPVERLPVRRPFQGIEGAGMLYNGSPGREAPLLPYDQRSGYRARIFLLSRFLRTSTPKYFFNLLFETLAREILMILVGSERVRGGRFLSCKP
jgi:hypothetical protein